MFENDLRFEKIKLKKNFPQMDSIHELHFKAIPILPELILIFPKDIAKIITDFLRSHVWEFEFSLHGYDNVPIQFDDIGRKIQMIVGCRCCDQLTACEISIRVPD